MKLRPLELQFKRGDAPIGPESPLNSLMEAVESDKGTHDLYQNLLSGFEDQRPPKSSISTTLQVLANDEENEFELDLNEVDPKRGVGNATSKFDREELEQLRDLEQALQRAEALADEKEQRETFAQEDQSFSLRFIALSL